MYKIGISCIGGGVGQSVVNSCKLSRLPIKTIGLDTNPFAYGAYDCDVFDYAPSVYNKNYMADLIEKCKKHHIDLIIPGLDDEILRYAQHIDKLKEAGTKTIVSGEELIKLCRDKEQMSLKFNRLANVFVASYNKNTLSDGIIRGEVTFPLIAKPRGGSASKGIEIIQNEDDLYKIGDSHIIQELAIPAKNDPNHEYYLRQIARNKNPQVSEISIQIVTAKDGKLLGRMASYNKLKNGIPVEIVPVEDDRIWKIVDELMPHFLELGLRGPLNIQGRLTEKGLKIFEMNPRFTGITGMRALMGFNEVESCIASWLNIGRENKYLTLNRNRFGVRQTADKVIPVRRNNKVRELSLRINTKPEKTVKTLLITGADSLLGRSFIHTIADEENYSIWIYGRNKDKLTSLFSQKDVHLYDNTDYESGKLSLGNIDILLHLGTAGHQNNKEEIADSLAFTNELFTLAIMHHVPAIINVSSQSVYGLQQDSLWNENRSAVPKSDYAQAMYATELMLQSLNRISNQVRVTSLRLAALTGGNPGLASVDVVAQLVQKALRGDKIKIVNGSQTLERLDIRDAAHAIKSILNTSEDRWKPIYNVGSGVAYNVKEIARMIIARADAFKNGDKSEIAVENKDRDVKMGMDSSLFRNDTGWEPAYRMNDTIDSLCRYFQAGEEVTHRSRRGYDLG